MAALAVPSEQELSQLSKSDLTSLLQRSYGKLKTQGDKLRKQAVAIKDAVAPHAKTAALDAADYITAAVGGGSVGMLMGTLQAKVLAGEEGFDEDSLEMGGLGWDAWIGIGLAGLAYALRFGKTPVYQTASHYVKTGALGALAATAGRYAYEYAMEPEEDETTA